MMFCKKLSKYFIFQDSNQVHCNLQRLNYSGAVSNEFPIRVFSRSFETSLSASMDTLLGQWLLWPAQKLRQAIWDTIGIMKHGTSEQDDNRNKVFSSFASLIRHFAKRLIEKAKYNKRKLWKNLKLSAFVVGAAPWLIPDPAWTSEKELTNSEGKKMDQIVLVAFRKFCNENFHRFFFSATMSYSLYGEKLHFVCSRKKIA